MLIDTRRRNGILSVLPPEDLTLLRPHLKAVDLPLRQKLAVANTAMSHVYFLDAGFASLVTRVRHGPAIEIGIVGREGFVNHPLLLGTDRSPNDTFMQMSGSGRAIEVGPFREIVAHSPTLARTLYRFIHVFMIQTASTVLANGRATVIERLARWLLMAHDRGDGDVLQITHEFLSIMLGVRRSGVSMALSEFERRGLLTRNRGNVALNDRAGLVEIASGYYGTAESEHDRLFGAPH